MLFCVYLSVVYSFSMCKIIFLQKLSKAMLIMILKASKHNHGETTQVIISSPDPRLSWSVIAMWSSAHAFSFLAVWKQVPRSSMCLSRNCSQETSFFPKTINREYLLKIIILYMSQFYTNMSCDNNFLCSPCRHVTQFADDYFIAT